MRHARPIFDYRLLVLPLVLSSALVGTAAAAAAPSVSFLAHQAVYDLSLKSSRGNANVNSARGRILYNFTGSACEGYTTEFRQVSQIDTGEDRTITSDLRSTSWEDAEGKTYRFKVETRMNEADPTFVDGIAERDGKTIKVKLKQPAAKTFTIDDAVFPTEQIKRIIEAAREGKSLLELTVYDGSDDGEKVYNTLTVIGQPIPGTKAPASPDATTKNDRFKALTRWPVTVSYYDKATQSKSGEQTPVYAMSFELFEDGVSRALVLDYNDFVIAGAMDKIDIKDTKPCK
ncbi:MAG: cell envelope integrity EipB family protein [Afipia sp.]|nr:cell envelope integrity EipB family protein [Afipia sp.]